MKETTAKKKNQKKDLSKKELERKIHSYLNQGLSNEEIFEKIKDNPDKESVSNFLFNSGLHRELLQMSISLFKENKEPSWTFTLPLIFKTKTKVTRPEFKMLFQKWLKDYSVNQPSVFACKKMKDVSSEFSKISEEYQSNLINKKLSAEDELLEKLDFVQSQGLIKEEEEIIHLLLKIDPDNTHYIKFQENLNEKVAIKILEDQKNSQHKNRLSEFKKKYFTAEKNKYKTKWAKAFQKASLKDPKNSKNFALFFAFLSWKDESLTLFEPSVQTLSDYWFYLDWLIETQQHTKALDLINQMITQLQTNPEASFPLNYMKSQILYSFGKKQEAIQHLNAILKVRPDYRSAQSLLDQWINE